MDVARPNTARRKKCQRVIYSTIAILALAGVTLGLSQSKPAAPTAERTSIWPDTVKRATSKNPMLRQVRGNGTLVPEPIQFVQSETDGRVERILVKPGAQVSADTVLVELSNAGLKQAAFDAKHQLKAGGARPTRLRVQLESEHLAQKATVATLKYEAEQPGFAAEADENLAKDGLVPHLTARQSRAKATAAVGMVIGIIASFGVARVLGGQMELFRVTATDPLSFLDVVVLLSVGSAAACLLPARRATMVDPMVALRYE